MKSKQFSTNANSIFEIYSSITYSLFLSCVSDEVECSVMYLCHQWA